MNIKTQVENELSGTSVRENEVVVLNAIGQFSTKVKPNERSGKKVLK